MEVQLYVYDLTNGLAKQMSMAMIGIHLEAVYHTSLVFDGIEYFFGSGVNTMRAGSTHHGRPIEIITLGTTQLPLEVILDYLESLKEVYTPESYDLFAHNCNNFTNDFSQFLLGKGIPEHITSLPRRVLDTPFGQMLRPQIEAGMRGQVQKPVDQSAQVNPRSTSAVTNGTGLGAGGSAQRTAVSAVSSDGRYGQVVDLTSLAELETYLDGAKETAATIFFTSSTCAPCKIAYPAFDSLAEQFSNALFVKVDLNLARDMGAKYQVRATPTFLTFSKAVKQDEWSGADPTLLKSNVETLMQKTFPPHPHTTLKVPSLQYGSLKPVTYAKIPPLDKLMTKLGEAGRDPQLRSLKSFISTRNEEGAKEAPLPDLHSISQTFRDKVLSLPLELRFAAIDLLRCAMIDPRVSGYFAEEQTPQLIPTILNHVNNLASCPHNLRLVTIQLACNLYTSHLYVREMTQGDNDLVTALIQLITISLLDVAHPSVRVSSAWLAFNLAATNYRVRREEKQEALADAEQVELAASLVETLQSEQNEETVKALLLSLGYVLYCAPEDGEVMDLCRALDVKSIVRECGKVEGVGRLAREVGSLV
ncbi:hypothetical protein LTR62_000233 [Meristemomyces frigidus]|uniref:Thioredoxin n=1 Tax=Meristemomyces frigidus TaxID=1508187 RepID=A0AAN7YNS3_9PEZI|nr:hypothetical protein LTR62_000233 [Meristemomyces frigidus]